MLSGLVENERKNWEYPSAGKMLGQTLLKNELVFFHVWVWGWENYKGKKQYDQKWKMMKTDEKFYLTLFEP